MNRSNISGDPSAAEPFGAADSLPILHTKLHRPGIGPSLERRTSLLERLERNCHRPLTLISAPAGYGKTSLASMWLQTSNYASAWVSLDERDDDLLTLTAYLVTAVRGAFPTLTLTAGLLLALGLAISTAPLTFVTTATAKRQGVSKERRRLLGILCFLALLTGAMLGYLVLRNQPLGVRLILVALESGFLITTVIQGIIPEANREGEPGFAGVLYIGGLSLYALMSLALK